MHCPSCGFENPEGLKFCNECGTVLKRRCTQCGFANAPQAKFCGECGTALNAAGKPTPTKARRGNGTPTQKRATRAVRQPATAPPRPVSPAGERRQLTVMFCDLVGSTALAEQLDPEEWREVVRAYQGTCAEVVTQYDGHIAQYLGDGLLIYFGYPGAHEDDAQRAARAGLGILAVLHDLTARRHRPVQVRIGIHTGLVVVGEMGTGGKREQLALGDTPNIAARLQGLAAPDTVVISAATHRLIEGLLDCRDLGFHTLKGVSTPVQVYQVVGESGVRSRLEAAATRGLTPLVGREEEVGLLHKRWEQSKAGTGQVVLLNGEAGIGKSRLVQILKEHIAQESSGRVEYRGSPYYQNSALYPLIDHLQRVLHFDQEDSPEDKVRKLEAVVEGGALQEVPLRSEAVALFASLLSLPLPAHYPALTLTPQRQKQKTLEALLAWLVKEAGRQPVLVVVEDVHWVDPSTLEFLSLLIDHVPTTRILLLLTFRLDFHPPWAMLSHMTQLTLSRLAPRQVEAMVEKVTGGKTLPTEVVQQLVAKTDGVPLFVEELTKMVLESVGARGQWKGQAEGAPVPLAIPTTLHDSLMARLDRLSTAREVAQLGAILGREFSYELIQAVSSRDEKTLQSALARLVEAELLYQRGLPPQARYLFKHALIQDAAYQSLLRSTRQQYHQQIAQVLEERFGEIKETQPEFIAYHYTEAGLIAQAIPYWQKAGQKAVEHSANEEAISHLMRGLELLKTLPDTLERAQQELAFQLTLGAPLIAKKGYAAPDVAVAYGRARELCQQIGENPHLFTVLRGLWVFYAVQGELDTARELGEQLLVLAQKDHDPAGLLEAHHALGQTFFHLGEFLLSWEHCKQGSILYDPQHHHAHVFLYGSDPGIACLFWGALALWFLGYPDQALARSREGLVLAQRLAHPLDLAYGHQGVASVYQYRLEGQAAQAQAEATIRCSTEQDLPFWLAFGTFVQGWALAVQRQDEEGIKRMYQGITAWETTGARVWQPYYRVPLAEAYGRSGRPKQGLSVLQEASGVVREIGERTHEAELYRLQGELTLQTHLQSPEPGVQEEAEECFLKAIEIARQQQAKSLELRAVVSLSRLWQQQGKQKEAHTLLAEIYGWFTEGFDTKDLQEAKALLEELEKADADI